MSWLPFISLLILFELIADIFAKKWSLSGHYLFWSLALAGYIVANIFWLVAIRSGSGLARGTVIFVLGSAVTAIILGVVFYKEPVSRNQLVGMALGVISLFLVLRG